MLLLLNDRSFDTSERCRMKCFLLCSNKCKQCQSRDHFGWHCAMKPLIMLYKSNKSHDRIKNCCSTAHSGFISLLVNDLYVFRWCQNLDCKILNTIQNLDHLNAAQDRFLCICIWIFSVCVCSLYVYMWMCVQA